MVPVRYYKASFKSALMVNGLKQLLRARKYVRQTSMKDLWQLGENQLPPEVSDDPPRSTEGGFCFAVRQSRSTPG
jgi:hypothetical protein